MVRERAAIAAIGRVLVHYRTDGPDGVTEGLDMSHEQAGGGNAAPYTIHCPHCRGSMRVAVEHVNVAVACPFCQEALEPWRLLESAPAPGYLNHAVAQSPVMYSWRNRWIAGALGVLLGGFGVHRFYLGHVGIGIAQIVVTVITFGVGSMWGFIEGILCFCGAIRDVDGLELSR